MPKAQERDPPQWLGIVSSREEGSWIIILITMDMLDPFEFLNTTL